jgi:hypothetical protein
MTASSVSVRSVCACFAVLLCTALFSCKKEGAAPTEGAAAAPAAAPAPEVTCKEFVAKMIKLSAEAGETKELLKDPDMRKMFESAVMDGCAKNSGDLKANAKAVECFMKSTTPDEAEKCEANFVEGNDIDPDQPGWSGSSLGSG